MLRALEPIGFYPFVGAILSRVAVDPFAEAEIRYRFLTEERRTGNLQARAFRVAVRDLAVLDKDYLTVPNEELGTLTSLLTMVGGRVVYADGPFAALGPDWTK